MKSNTMLNDFVLQYDKVVGGTQRTEEDEDFHTENSMAALTTTHPYREACR